MSDDDYKKSTDHRLDILEDHMRNEISWRGKHDGQVMSWWKEVWIRRTEWNKWRCLITARVSKLEMRFLWVIIAAFTGGLAGNYLSTYFPWS